MYVSHLLEQDIIWNHLSHILKQMIFLEYIWIKEKWHRRTHEINLELEHRLIIF